MRLKSVQLTNFRGYRATGAIPIDGLITGIIGGYDDGQSTIPEVLAMFFESGDVKTDKSNIDGFSLAGLGRA